MPNSDKLKKLFKNEGALDLALTHRSWVNEHPNVRESNERLEFLGDAVLEFIVSKKLYETFPEKPEGFLTALRANLVNTVNLSKVAKSLEVGKLLFLSKGEEDGGGRDNPTLLANTIEAIIGAIYLDSGIDGAYDFINKNIFADLSEKASEPLKDPKSILQEEVQAQGYPAPKYVVVDEQGPDHAKNFTIDVFVNGKALGKGAGKNKSEAAQNAAQEALSQLETKSL